METHAIADLQGRYGLNSKQSVYDRIKALSIEPVARGKISSEQLNKLDKLNEHLKSGGNLGDFESNHIEVMATTIATIEPTTPAKLTSSDGENFIELIERVAAALKPTADPLQHYTALERAIASSWLLSTAEVRSLIGTKPMGDRFQRGSFIFIRSGRIGSQSAWRVAKVVIGGGVYSV